jgi:hypothetical protein
MSYLPRKAVPTIPLRRFQNRPRRYFYRPGGINTGTKLQAAFAESLDEKQHQRTPEKTQFPVALASIQFTAIVEL